MARQNIDAPLPVVKLFAGGVFLGLIIRLLWDMSKDSKSKIPEKFVVNVPYYLKRPVEVTPPTVDELLKQITAPYTNLPPVTTPPVATPTPVTPPIVPPVTTPPVAQATYNLTINRPIGGTGFTVYAGDEVYTDPPLISELWKYLGKNKIPVYFISHSGIDNEDDQYFFALYMLYLTDEGGIIGGVINTPGENYVAPSPAQKAWLESKSLFIN